MDMKSQRQHRTPDAYQLYEFEHKPHTLDKVPSISSTPHAEKPAAFYRHNENRHGKSHRPQDAFQLYELEHRPQRVPSIFPKTDHEAVTFDQYEKGRNEQYCLHPIAIRDGNVAIPEVNIDRMAEKFITMKHHKFELSKTMSTNYRL